eukprot:scaffold1858_cov267-Amphora_coffeaeformis.AAC.2
MESSLVVPAAAFSKTKASLAAAPPPPPPSCLSAPSESQLLCPVVVVNQRVEEPLWLVRRENNDSDTIASNDGINSAAAAAANPAQSGHARQRQAESSSSPSSGISTTTRHLCATTQQEYDRKQISYTRDDDDDDDEVKDGAMMRLSTSQRVGVGRGHSRQYHHHHHTITRLSTLVWVMICLVLPFSCLINPAYGFRSPLFSPVTVYRPNGSSSWCSTTARYGTSNRPDGGGENSSNNKNNRNDDNKNPKRRSSSSSSRRRANGRASPASASHNVTTFTTTTSSSSFSSMDALHRITQLEDMVAKQAVEIKRLRDECKSLTEAVNTFASVMELLRDAGLNPEDENNTGDNSKASSTTEATASAAPEKGIKPKKHMVESLEDDDEIFGKAPSSIMDAADAAGAAVLAGLLAGQRRLLVDVRDAELSKPEQLVQFLELTILPVAAGLEGLKSKRNRLKLVFPKVSQLLEYRKTMALAAPEVVALSTMDFDPIESHDNLVVLLAPHPDDTEGVQAMNALLDHKSGITQPVVVFNPHMAPVSDPAADFEVAYQLRLFTVHYIAKPPPPATADDGDDDTEQTKYLETKDQLAAAMQHAKEVSRNPAQHGGTTRSMLIRAYPNPWNVFVDISPDTDADFVVAATFAQEPTPHELNTAVIECLQGSEEEDELVAQQMQQALEAGQLDRVSELLGSMGLDFSDDEDDDGEDDDDDEEDLWQLPDVDTV